ncbi:MAG: DNA/RNA non-specific endonuclease [Chloroflexota bacterium]
MIEIPSLRPETRYGLPPADQFLFNREYIVGYSYLFRQPRWALEVIDPENRREAVERIDSYRPDLRVPEKFRADLADFEGSGYDRGHLVASADRRASRVENSETFLLTNMSPQAPSFNRGIWKQLEEAVRDLARQYVETYVISGPLFNIGQPVDLVGDEVVIPHAFFKSILAEDHKGRHTMWSFIFPNDYCPNPIESYMVTTLEVEYRSGLPIWDRLRGESGDLMRLARPPMWEMNRVSIYDTLYSFAR